MGLEGLGDLMRPRCFKSTDAFQQRLLVCCCFSGMHGPASQDRARIVLDWRMRMVRSQSTRKAQMKTILMLIVGLMLAGCGSMENHVRNDGVASTSRPPLPDPKEPFQSRLRLCGDISRRHSVASVAFTATYRSFLAETALGPCIPRLSNLPPVSPLYVPLFQTASDSSVHEAQALSECHIFGVATYLRLL